MLDPETQGKISTAKGGQRKEHQSSSATDRKTPTQTPQADQSTKRDARPDHAQTGQSISKYPYGTKPTQNKLRGNEI